MTLAEKITFIREERFQDLNDWEKDFMEDMYSHVQDPEEELSRRQIEKIDEIWENLGL